MLHTSSGDFDNFVDLFKCPQSHNDDGTTAHISVRPKSQRRWWLIQEANPAWMSFSAELQISGYTWVMSKHVLSFCKSIEHVLKK